MHRNQLQPNTRTIIPFTFILSQALEGGEMAAKSSDRTGISVPVVSVLSSSIEGLRDGHHKQHNYKYDYRSHIHSLFRIGGRMERRPPCSAA